MDIQALEKMPKTELVNLAREAGIPCDGRTAQNAIIAALVAKVSEVATPVQNVNAEQEPPKRNRVFFSSREEIEAITPKNVEIIWHGDDTLTAKGNGVEECMTQHQSIEVIKRRMRDMAKGAFKIQMTKDGALKEGAYWDKVSA